MHNYFYYMYLYMYIWLYSVINYVITYMYITLTERFNWLQAISHYTIKENMFHLPGSIQQQEATNIKITEIFISADIQKYITNVKYIFMQIESYFAVES